MPDVTFAEPTTTRDANTQKVLGILPPIQEPIPQTVAPTPIQRPISDHGSPHTLPPIQEQIHETAQPYTPKPWYDDKPTGTTVGTVNTLMRRPLTPGQENARDEAVAAVAYLLGYSLTGAYDGLTGSASDNENLLFPRDGLEDASYELGRNFGDLIRDSVTQSREEIKQLIDHPPHFEIPTIKMPKFDRPELPKFEIPKIPEFEIPEIPKFEIPKIPDSNPFPKPTVPEPQQKPQPEPKETDIPRLTEPKENEEKKPHSDNPLEEWFKLPGSDNAICFVMLAFSAEVENNKIKSINGGANYFGKELPPAWGYRGDFDVIDGNGMRGYQYQLLDSNGETLDEMNGYVDYVYSCLYGGKNINKKGEWVKVTFPDVKDYAYFKSNGQRMPWAVISNSCGIVPPPLEPPPPPPPPPPEDCDCAMTCCPEIDYRKIRAIVEEEVKKLDVTAAIPLSWQIRHEGENPQMVIQFAERKSAASGNTPAKYDSAKYPITVPHWKGGKNDKPSLPPYKKGNWEGILVLKDNSKVTINAQSEAECIKILNAIKPWIKSNMLEDSYFKCGKIKTKEPIKEIQVYPKYGRYFGTGQKNNKPDWRVDFP